MVEIQFPDVMAVTIGLVTLLLGEAIADRVVGIAVGNLEPLVPVPKPVADTPALSLVSELALGVFLAVALMAPQLWALAGMAGTLLAVLLVRTVVAIAASVLVAFRFLGRDYPAAVTSAGYASFVLGATPTAIATMTAVTERPAAGRRRLRRLRQRPRHPGLPRPVDMSPAPTPSRSSGLHTALKPGEQSFSAHGPKTSKETLRAPARTIWPQLRPAAARRVSAAAPTPRT